MIENKDYELIPTQDGSSELWDIRILKGDYVENVIRFGAISVEDDGMLHFNFEVISSPNDISVNDIQLQDQASQILISIIEDSIERGNGISITDRENGEKL